MQHTLSADNGYTVSLELDSKLPEEAVEDLAEENKGGLHGYRCIIPRQENGTREDHRWRSKQIAAAAMAICK